MPCEIAAIRRGMILPMKLAGKGLECLCLAVFGSLFLLLSLAFEYRPPTRL